MNRQIEILFKKSKLNNIGFSNSALTDLGLLVERHTQNRYEDDSYLYLFSSKEIFEIKPEDKEIEVIINFFFYYIININHDSVTVAWCIGKCYGFDIILGLVRLLNIFNEDDQVSLQLLYSINSLYDFRNVKDYVIPILNEIILNNKLDKTIEYINELYYTFNIK
ncbi:MAG TPA: hypothetical protein VF677_11795 [Flavobacterium sp.]|jgi:hypothetical protein